MNHQSDVAGAVDANKEAKDDNEAVKKVTKQIDLRQKINKYLENKNTSSPCETRQDDNKTNQNDAVALRESRKIQEKPCNYFNDFGTCNFKSVHSSKSGAVNLLHICRFCYESYGRKDPHPASLCAQLKTHGGLLDHGVSLKVDDLNKMAAEKGTEQELGEEISAKLQEPKVDMIVGVVRVIGRDAAIDIFKKTQKVESDGGMMIKNGVRRRTAGGTFLQLMRENASIDQENIAAFFNNFNGIQVTKTHKNEKTDSDNPLVQSYHLKSIGTKICTFDNNRVKQNSNIEDDGDAMNWKSKHINLPNSPDKFGRPMGSNGMALPGQPGMHGDYLGIQARYMTGMCNNQTQSIRSMATKDISARSTPRSNLVQDKANFGNGKYERTPQLGKSTPKSRLSETMENYNSNFGSNKDGRTFSCMGRTQDKFGQSQDQSYGSQSARPMWNYQKLDSRKASIDQIIGCLSQQKNECPKKKLNEGNGGLLADTSYKQDQECMEKREAEHKNPFMMRTSIRNEPWLAAYNVAKEKAVHNFETGNLQSVGGISGYCGQVTNATQFTSNYQISKWMTKMKMDERKESQNEHKIPEKKTLNAFEGKYQNGITGRKATSGTGNQLGLFDEANVGIKRPFLNPTAAPFNPSAAMFNPLTPPPFLKYPSVDSYPRDSQESAVMLTQRNHYDILKVSHENIGSNGAKKIGNTNVEYNQVILSKERIKSSFILHHEGRKKYDVSIEMDKEKGKIHCPCPPYCPPCLKNIKAKI